MPIQRWRCPVALQVKSAVLAAAAAGVAGVFFPLWFAVPVMAVCGVWGAGMCVRRPEVAVDAGAGLVVFRLGLVTRRIRLASVTAVQADRTKVSVARSDGHEVSFYAWGKSPLDRWLRMPDAAGDIAHAVSRAAAGAREAQSADGTGARPGGGGPAARWSRRPLAAALLGCTGLAAVGAAFLVRVSWPSPVMTALGALLALALGLSGVGYVMVSLWLVVRGRAEWAPGDRAGAA